ncbi:MAG: cytochrome C [Gallionellaceae bacterium]|jgi:cytochrome c|nr:cytochrome C [Gallionellaceae bacterium]
MQKLLITTCLVMLHASPVWAADMPPLASQYGCTACHDLDKIKDAPSWMEISKHYRGIDKFTFENREYALEDGLVEKVSKGGSGNWGYMPMPPNDPDRLHQSDMRELVKFILQLAR